MITFKKTRAGSELHMGALLRDALARQGVSVRVDRPWPSLPTEYLVAEAPDRPSVWITAHDCNGSTHYDTHRRALMGVTAVVTDEQNTRFVFCGLDADTEARPAAQAEACAAAVAEFFGLPVPAPEHRRCLHCGRSIEWIEADGQGAWHDSSNWIACVDGESLHSPEPLCGWCEDTGLITLYDASTDGITGHRPCDSAPCAKRRKESAARLAQKHTDPFTDGTQEFGPQICAECHWGGFAPNGQHTLGRPDYMCTADGCGHTVAHADLTKGLTDGQSLTVVDGRLYVAEPYSGPPLPPF
ncbi:hypothetical protein ACWD0J_16955 [Streptomyces sp. NPDC003011]